MTPEQHERAMQVFNEAAALTVEERATFVADACGDDATVRAEVDSLLAHDAGQESGFDSPALGSAFNVRQFGEQQLPPSHDHPKYVGAYRILEPLGEGGMGIVYLAEQTEPVKRRVALKVVKPGMDSREVIARFESERQALAMMSHPNVARVFDAGVNEQGRPYFVMELVKGERITDHCDRLKLSLEKRIELFLHVCEAVQHAHQKGIIHRDLKPGNILVERNGREPAPKVIDFGVAKATDQRLTEKTLFTHQGQMVGTPEYMSPEQAEMAGQRIDTRTDIYSLGVLLYELLTGSRPFDSQTLREAGLEGIARTIRESEPPKPSTRLSKLLADESDSVTSSAASRMTDAQSLVRRVRGDLDWIVMRCLEKDPDRRYETPSALAQDLRRHLANEPVIAGPPSASYKLRKFVRRNRGGVLAGSVIALALIAAVVGITVGLIESKRSAMRMERTLDFITDDLLAPTRDDGKHMTLSELLVRAEPKVSRQFAGDPVSEATIWRVFGLNHASIEELESALKAFRKALDLREAEYGVASSEAMEVRADLARTLDQLGRHDEAETLWKKSLDLQVTKHGEEHENTAQAYNDLAVHYINVGQHAEAEPLVQKAVDFRRRHLGEEHPDTIGAMNNLAMSLLGQHKSEEALPLFRKTVAKYRQDPGVDDPFTINMINNLGIALMDTGAPDAEPVVREARELYRGTTEGENWGYYMNTIQLAKVIERQGRYAEAEELYREGAAYLREYHERNEPQLQYRLMEVARNAHRQNKWVEAEAALRECMELQQEFLPDEKPYIAFTAYWLAYYLIEQGRFNEAEPLIEECVAIRNAIDAKPQLIAEGESLLGRCRVRSGEYEEGERLLLNAYANLSESPDDPLCGKRNVHQWIVEMYRSWGRQEEAREWEATMPTSDESK